MDKIEGGTIINFQVGQGRNLAVETLDAGGTIVAELPFVETAGKVGSLLLFEVEH